MTADDAGTQRVLDDASVLDVLRDGELEIEGRLLDASNATLVGRSELDGVSLRCVYKPVAGERPLWDFPDGTLGHREVAAYEVSAATDWGLVPPTAWRTDGPLGPGMCQLWVDTAPDEAAGLVDVVPPAQVPEGWSTVLRAQDAEGRPVALVHADVPPLRRMVLLDAVINNADRKGGHVLVRTDGAVRGVDHGVTFNEDDKLRTVLWGWAGDPIPAALVEELCALRSELAPTGRLRRRLAPHLDPAEVSRTVERLDELIASATFPNPSGDWPPIPWPAF